MTDKTIEHLVAALIAAEQALNTAPNFRCGSGNSYSVASYIGHVMRKIPPNVMEKATERFDNFQSWSAISRNVYNWGEMD